jgi:hypothetical protein
MEGGGRSNVTMNDFFGWVVFSKTVFVYTELHSSLRYKFRKKSVAPVDYENAHSAVISEKKFTGSSTSGPDDNIKRGHAKILAKTLSIAVICTIRTRAPQKNPSINNNSASHSVPRPRSFFKKY